VLVLALLSSVAFMATSASAATKWKTKSVGSCTVAAGINADTTNHRYYIAGYIVCREGPRA